MRLRWYDESFSRIRNDRGRQRDKEQARDGERARGVKRDGKGGRERERKREERVASWRNVGLRSVGSSACTVHPVVYLNAYGTVLIVHTRSHGPMN